MVFFELRTSDRSDIEALNKLREVNFGRIFYSPVILRGEGRNPDSTGLVERYHSVEPHPELFAKGGLLDGLTMTATMEIVGLNIGEMLMWLDTYFSRFSFDLLALLNGTYKAGLISSFHGLDIRQAESTK